MFWGIRLHFLMKEVRPLRKFLHKLKSIIFCCFEAERLLSKDAGPLKKFFHKSVICCLLRGSGIRYQGRRAPLRGWESKPYTAAACGCENLCHFITNS